MSIPYTYLKYGKAHFNNLISGSKLFATDSKTIILVRRVAN